MTTKEQEEYLFKIAKRILKWAEVKYKPSELADLIMLELINY